MPCTSRMRQGSAEKAESKKKIKKLGELLAKGQVTVEISPQGAIAFKGWKAEDRGFWSDVCAYRTLRLENPFALRQAIARAEAISGRKVNEQAIAAGVHSHDGGKTWGSD